jgi:tetratricopeptide (TPR) repeat protein
MRAEIGIHEAATMDEEMNDAAVRKVVNGLIARLLRGESMAVQAEGAASSLELIEWRIKDNLAYAFKEHGPISNTDLIGCLRVILASIDTWSGRPLGQRGYLGYLAGFMKQLGVEVRLLSHDETVKMGLAKPKALPAGYKPDQMTLEELGRFWLKHDAEIIELIDDFANRALADVRDGRAESVVQICRTLLAETDDPDQQAELYYHIGVGLRHLNQLEASIDALQATIELQEDFCGAIHELGETYFVKGDYRSAIATWRHELDEAPENTPTWLDIARACRAQGDDPREERALRRVVERHPHSVEALVRLTECLRRQDREREALVIGKRVVSTLPGSPTAFSDWAYWLRLKLEMPGYGPDPLKALAQEEKRKAGFGWVNLLKAVAYQQMGRSEAAQRELALAWERTSSPYAWQRQLDFVLELFPAFRPDVDEIAEGTISEPEPSDGGFWSKLFGRGR